MPLIECKSLTLAYENVQVVKNLSFSLSEGDYLCIIGENGSGKSTLLKALVGLMPVKEGSITFDGIKKTEIGYLPQQTDSQKTFPASVYEIVLSGCIARANPFYNKKLKERAKECMTLLGLSGLENRSYRELSGGQQQRVLLARAVCATAKLIILDEPTSFLDVNASSELYNSISNLNKNYGITVIMVSHDVERALKNATHVLHMHSENPFFSDKHHYLECDDCKKLLGEVHTCGNNN